jgi:aerobic-type carbon monoxide dehydrogenase small subunit (CoxS/CutS family)
MRTLSQSLVIQNLKADHELSSTRWGCTTRKCKALVVVEQERRTKTPHWLGRRAARGAAAATAAASERASKQEGMKDADKKLL